MQAVYRKTFTQRAAAGTLRLVHSPVLDASWHPSQSITAVLLSLQHPIRGDYFLRVLQWPYRSSPCVSSSYMDHRGAGAATNSCSNHHGPSPACHMLLCTEDLTVAVWRHISEFVDLVVPAKNIILPSLFNHFNFATWLMTAHYTLALSCSHEFKSCHF